jgi:hypothetical protein
MHLYAQFGLYFPAETWSASQMPFLWKVIHETNG